MISVFIENNPLFHNKVKWFFELIIKNHGAQVELVDHFDNKTLKIGLGEVDVVLSEGFYDNLNKNIFDHKLNMINGPYILNANKEIDYISTVFYLVNCIQEYGNKDLDAYGRFKYENSLQLKWNIILENTAYNYILIFCEKYKIKTKLLKTNMTCLSHDIDFLNQGWKHELVWSLKSIRFKSFCRILYRKITNIGVFNTIDDLLQIEKRLCYQSIFFWIPKMGNGAEKIGNADYDIHNKGTISLLEKVHNSNCQNGLHKSTQNLKIAEEIKLIAKCDKINRYHYLKFNLPNAWDDIQESEISVDFSLGFAEHFGYRNSYGLPFKPYCLKNDKPYKFLLVPLHVMDTTLIKYMKLTQTDIMDKLLSWIDSVKDHTLISILWHNNYVSDYSNSNMKTNYVKLLEYFYSKQIISINSNQIIEKYY